jgi:hypothetical protein
MNSGEHTLISSNKRASDRVSITFLIMSSACNTLSNTHFHISLNQVESHTLELGST